MKKILLVSLILSTSITMAADLKPPFVFNNAKVLPLGVRNLSYKGAMIEGKEKFDDGGNSTVVAAPLFKDITFQELIDGKMDPTEKGAIQQAMYSIGANPDDTFGQTQGQVNVEALASVTVFAWGVTPKITFGTVIPVLQSSVNVSKGMVQVNASLYDKFTAALVDKGADKKAAEFESKMLNPITAKEIEYNYQVSDYQKKTELGDVRLLAKYLILENNLHRVTLQTDVTLPTGKPADYNKLVSVASGDGQTDIGASVFYDYTIDETITASASTGYTVQLKDTQALRVPERESSKITPDIDQNVNRDLGDVAFFQTNVNYMNDLTMGVGYAIQLKGKDKFEGSKFATERYKWLSKETKQEMHSALFSVGYETVSAFKRKEFAAPITISLNHARVFKGRNVVKDPITTLDFSLFF